VHVVPYAVCGLERTDFVSEPDDHRLSRNGSLSGRQTDGGWLQTRTALERALAITQLAPETQQKWEKL
jgi:hypothetical protein